MPVVADRALKVGLLLPMAEGMFNGRTARWQDLRDLASTAEDVGFDSIWLIDHLLLPVGRWVDGAEPVGGWECWSMLSALAAETRRLTLGTFMTCTAFRNPALLAKMADTVNEISGGRLILGLGAGSVQSELPIFGYATDHPVSRFEEALQIITGLLRDGQVDFAGRYYTARECELRPRGPDVQGPPIMIGSRQPRMDRLAARYADIWNGSWHNRAERLQPRTDAMREACISVSRDPSTLALTAGVMIDLPRLESQPDWPWGGVMRTPAGPMTGTTDELVEELLAYEPLGVSHLQLWVDPLTPKTIEGFAPIIERLEGLSPE